MVRAIILIILKNLVKSQFGIFSMYVAQIKAQI
jgi:hypothetical protein